MSCLWFWCGSARDPDSDMEDRMENLTLNKKSKRRKWRIGLKKENIKDADENVEQEVDLPSVSAETMSPPPQEIPAITERLLKKETETVMVTGEVEASTLKVLTTSLVYSQEGFVEEPLEVNTVTTEAEAVTDAAAATSPSLGDELHTGVERAKEQAAPSVVALPLDMVLDTEMLQADVKKAHVEGVGSKRKKKKRSRLPEMQQEGTDQRLENETLHSVPEPEHKAIRALVDTSTSLESESGADLLKVNAAESAPYHHIDNTNQQSVDEIPTMVLIELASEELLDLVEMETERREAANIPVTTEDPVTVIMSKRLEQLVEDIVRRREYLLVNEILATMAAEPENKGLVMVLELLLNDYDGELDKIEANEQLQLTSLVDVAETGDELHTGVEHAKEQAAPPVEELLQEELVLAIETLQDKAVNNIPAAEAVMDSLSRDPNIFSEETSNNQLVADVKDGVGRKRKTRRGTRGRGRKINYKQEKKSGEVLGLVQETTDQNRCEPTRRTQRQDQWREQRAVTEKLEEQKRSWNHDQRQASRSRQDKELRSRRSVPQPRDHHY